MNRRNLLKTLGVGAVGGRFAADSIDAAYFSRPNFLFTIADDVTFRAIHSLNNSEIQTPNLDRLVRRGCSFTHCFHQGSWLPAVCIASRSMLHSGLTVFRAQRRIEQTPLWAETPGGSGYDTSNLKKDPREIHNLADDSKSAALKGSLLARLHRFQRELEDDLPPFTVGK